MNLFTSPSGPWLPDSWEGSCALAIKTILTILFIASLGASQVARAQQNRGQLPGSELVESLAEGIDQRLAGKNNQDRRVTNKTSLRLENSTLWTEGGSLENSWHVGVDLHLPQVENYWAVKFGTYDEREEERRLDQRIFRRTPREESPGARFALFHRFEKVDVSFEPRVEFKDPMGMSYLLKMTTAAEYQRYTLSPRLELFARHERGTGAFFSFDTGYGINPVWRFHVLNEGEYQDHENLFNSNTGFTLFQKLLPTMNLSYGFAFHSFNRPAYHLQEYGPSISWDVYLWKNALRSSLTPFMTFRKAQQFKGAPGLQYTLSALF